MKTTTDAETAWDYLLESSIATEDELKLASNLIGYSLETMEAVLYAKTGYRSFDQLES